MAARRLGTLLTGSPPQCGTLRRVGPNENLTERSLQDAQRLFLMSEAVQPVTRAFVTQAACASHTSWWTLCRPRIRLYHVLYIGTGEAAPPHRCSGWEGGGVGDWAARFRGHPEVQGHLIWSLQSGSTILKALSTGEPQPPRLLPGGAARAAPGAGSHCAACACTAPRSSWG